MPKPKKTSRVEQPNPVAMAILSAHDAAMRAGLYRTGHALDASLNMVGWELAGTPEKSRYVVIEKGARK